MGDGRAVIRSTVLSTYVVYMKRWRAKYPNDSRVGDDDHWHTRISREAKLGALLVRVLSHIFVSVVSTCFYTNQLWRGWDQLADKSRWHFPECLDEEKHTLQCLLNCWSLRKIWSRCGGEWFCSRGHEYTNNVMSIIGQTFDFGRIRLPSWWIWPKIDL